MQFIRHFFWCFLLFSFSCGGHKNKERGDGEQKTTPNILIIIADDAGWNDVGYNGSEINTPNIDFLAKNGVQLNRFYTNSTCSPSRVSLLTGMPSSRIGIVAPISGKSTKTLPDSIVTLPQVLKQNNYQTALFGKWHLGLNIENGPNTFGFDYSYGFLHGQIDQYTHRYKNGDASWYRNNNMIEETGHATDLITKETIDWITTKRDTTKNFYIQLAYSAPHFPLQEEKKWKIPYAKTVKDSSRIDFAAAMAHMDYGVGQVLETLKKQKLNNNTLIIFFSDNGAMENWYPTDQYNGKFRPNPVLGSNRPLRDWKTTNYEGALRVPALAYWKGHLAAFKSTRYMAVYDIMPTVLSLIGVNSPKNVEGVSVWPSLLTNTKTNTHSNIYIRGHIQECLIHPPYKIIRTRYKNGSPALYELYNIEADQEEKHNLITQDLALTKTMKTLLQAQFEKDDKTVNVELK
ncbi:MAG: sulfatase [Flavobacteriaceae bacterium]